MHVFNFTKEDLEEALDQAKAAVLLDLVYEGIVDFDTAERYATVKTVVLRKKGFFKTITDRWKKTEADDGYVMVIVGNDHIDNTIPAPPRRGKLTSLLNRIIREDVPKYDGPTISG
jgi:hypothetical protein